MSGYAVLTRGPHTAALDVVQLGFTRGVFLLGQGGGG